jgi:hypothetical protein
MAAPGIFFKISKPRPLASSTVWGCSIPSAEAIGQKLKNNKLTVKKEIKYFI